MLTLIIKKELRDIISSQKFVWSFLVASILILLAFYVGAKNFQLQQRQYEAAQAENIRQMQGITDWTQVKHHIFLPPQPLYALVNGIDNDIGRNIEMYGIGELSADDSRFMEDPLFAAFRFLDLQFLFVIVLTLFAIMFGYNMINGEKENGTLRLVFANGIPKDTFILGKLCGVLLSVTIPLILPLLLGALLLIILGIPMQIQDWLRLAIITSAGLLLFAFFLVLSVFFSALTPHSSTSFLYMIVVWIFFVLIWPRSAVLLAGRAVEVPSVDEIAYKKAGFRSQVWQEDMQAMNNFKPSQTGDMQAMMSEFQQFMADQSDKRNEKTNAFNARLNQERENRQKIQQKTAFMFSRISPVTSFTITAMQIAGTGIELKNTFRDNAKRYQELYAKFLKERIDGALPGAGLILRMVNDDDEAKPIDPAEIPVFQYRAAELSEDIQNSALDIGLLFVLNLLAFAASVFVFMRFDVR